MEELGKLRLEPLCLLRGGGVALLLFEQQLFALLLFAQKLFHIVYKFFKAAQKVLQAGDVAL